MELELKNQRISDADFMAERKEVLQQWPTGADINFDEAVEYQKVILFY